MLMRWLFWFWACFWASEIVMAQDWGIGAVVGEGSGLSLSYRPTRPLGMHFTAKAVSEDEVAFQGDVQKFFRPLFLLQFGVEAYSGLGLLGEAARHQGYEEDYYLVVPLGLQWQNSHVPVHLFVEQSVIAGALPLTKVSGRVNLGIRALF